MKDYRVTVKVRNNRLINAIAEAGGEPGGKWCSRNGLNYISVNDLINMTASPIRSDGSLRDVAAHLCDVLGKTPDDLWSAEQIYPLEKNFSDMEMDFEQIQSLTVGGETTLLLDVTDIEAQERKTLLSSVLERLSPRRRDVLRMRFEDGLTLDEAGKVLGITGFRVRQIEEDALRRLRHPDCKAILADLIE